jgi:hypothetical protein
MKHLEHLLPRDRLMLGGEGGAVVPAHQDDDERWRALAAEARTTATQLTDPEAKRTLLFIAAAYERLACHAAARKRGKE